LLLVGVRGTFSPPIPSERIGSIFSSPRKGHSVKPECVYKWIERAFPDAQKLEMYSRVARPGWAVFGIEV
jgi:N6-adenosine-specific RNA methylase IME4